MGEPQAGAGSGLEEAKILLEGSASNFSVLVAWFNFFFTFELTALGYLYFISTGDPATKDQTIVAVSFICFHLFGIAAVAASCFSSVTVIDRLKSLSAEGDQRAALLSHPRLHISCCIAMLSGLTVSTFVWVWFAATHLPK